MNLRGFQIGHAQDEALRSGTTVIVPDRPAIAAVHIMGGAPGTRETDLLSPEQLVQHIDAIALSGGSAFGLDAASGVQAWLREQGRGFPVGEHRVPIVPAAILYDLANGGDKSWGRYPPYRELGYTACRNLNTSPKLGSVGAGLGATVQDAEGGFGLAEERLDGGITICSVAVCNAVGSAYISGTDHFWAAPFEIDGEFGGRGYPDPIPASAAEVSVESPAVRGANTTLAVVMTNATLTQAECKRMAINAHDGFARAVYPVHTPLDGDIVFVLSSNDKTMEKSDKALMHLYTAAARTVTRAIARGVFEANPR